MEENNFYSESRAFSSEEMRELSERLYLDSRRYDSGGGRDLWNV